MCLEMAGLAPRYSQDQSEAKQLAISQFPEAFLLSSSAIVSIACIPNKHLARSIEKKKKKNVETINNKI